MPICSWSERGGRWKMWNVLKGCGRGREKDFEGEKKYRLRHLRRGCSHFFNSQFPKKNLTQMGSNMNFLVQLHLGVPHPWPQQKILSGTFPVISSHILILPHYPLINIPEQQRLWGQSIYFKCEITKASHPLPQFPSPTSGLEAQRKPKYLQTLPWMQKGCEAHETRIFVSQRQWHCFPFSVKFKWLISWSCQILTETWQLRKRLFQLFERCRSQGCCKCSLKSAVRDAALLTSSQVAYKPLPSLHGL